MPVPCTHLATAPTHAPNTPGCQECSKTGASWVALRCCQSCGYVGCCDSTPGMHATAHFKATGHPVMKSNEPGQSWRWCYVDEMMGE